MTTWLEDTNGNRCSVEYFGSKAAAQKALDSLKDCRGCIDCSDCADCSGCADCSHCSGCSDCSCCSDCSDCSRCSGCRGCTNCSRCFGCSCIACLTDKQALRGDPSADLLIANGQPPIPKIKDIHRKVYEAVTAKDHALDMSEWHTCGTTHCRGGWVVHLADEAGYALERFHNTALAAQLIYRKSGYEINPCRFYDSNEDALADMKRLAEESA